MLKSLFVAFGTYSVLPTPHTEWDEKSMRYAICFFPLIGALIGALEVLWALACERFLLPDVLRGAVAAVLPLLLTGGIHMDGFCDTLDAIASRQSRERKLEILKDSHVGAFAVIFSGAYLLCFFAAWSALEEEFALLAAVGFVLSRALSGFALTNWKCAREDGMLRAFSDAAAKKTVTVCMLGISLLCAAAMVLLGGLYGLAALGVNLLMLAAYRAAAMRHFGGVTGDVSGWFLQMCELSTVFSLAILTNIF